MTTNIILTGLSFEKPEIVERFSGSKDELKARLINLQSGYCNTEKPKVQTIKKDNKQYFESYSYCDYSYVARFK